MTLPFAERLKLRPFIQQALDEDLGEGDITSELLIPEDAEAILQFRNREPLVAAGLFLPPMVFTCLEQNFRAEAFVEDGDRLMEPTLMMEVRGNARTLLAGERVALNLLQRLCGVASHTARFVAAVEGTGVRILDTRKTTPGLRVLEKYAVTCGGGFNHRMRLDDGILIKDNHLAISGSITQAIEKARAGNTGLSIEVECDTLDQVREAIAAKADWVLLDNMPPEMMRQAVALGHQQVKFEASGGVTLQSIAAIAASGVDAISIGALTHSAPAVDIGLDAEIIPSDGLAD